jgi:hypothetical protein
MSTNKPIIVEWTQQANIGNESNSSNELKPNYTKLNLDPTKKTHSHVLLK